MRDWLNSGAPWIWLTGGAVSISVVMVVGLLWLIAARGLGHFWPQALYQFEYRNPDGSLETVIGEIHGHEQVRAAYLLSQEADAGGDEVGRVLVKTGNRDLSGHDFRWLDDRRIEGRSSPTGLVAVERREWGNVYGYLLDVREEGRVVAAGDAVWAALPPRIARVQTLYARITTIETQDIGALNYRLERLRLSERRLDLDHALDAAAQRDLHTQRAALDAELGTLQDKLRELNAALGRDSLSIGAADGQVVEIPLSKVVRDYRPNAMGLSAKLGFYFGKLWEFVSAEPREANTEGGVFPAIFGTVLMVMLMAVLVTPLGVIAAVYLHEYAKQGALTRLIRIAVNNLAGVPSIVYGMFGLGFFVYFVGGRLDEWLFPERLPAPTFGSPGLLWSSLTLALLTLPVVIVATEEGLSRIPSSVREASLALGATKAETLWRTVLPMATPAIMTGLILAVARAAGEVAPLMLVGVVKLAPALPLDLNPPYLHLERQFMHLGFHIYDVGFQSPNIEAAQPLVYATALLLVLVIVVLNLAAIGIRNHLREKFRALESA